MSHERNNVAEAETLGTVEGKMCGIAMRDAVAPPGSKATSRPKGTRRNLRDLMSGHRLQSRLVPHREGEEPKPMMHGHEKSDSAIVATKPPNKGLVTGRGGGGAKGGGQGEHDPLPHVPDTGPGKRVTGAGARTEGRVASRHHPSQRGTQTST